MERGRRGGEEGEKRGRRGGGEEEMKGKGGMHRGVGRGGREGGVKGEERGETGRQFIYYHSSKYTVFSIS